VTTTAALDFTHGQVRVDIEEMWMRPGLGGHELRFPLKLQAPWLSDDAVESFELLSIHARIDSGTSSALHPLGQASLMCLVRRFPTTEQLYLVITDEQLLGLEHIRGQGGIDFQFDMSATLSNGDHARLEWVATQARYAVTPGRWLELLDQVGAATTITVRAPSPFTDAAPDGNALAPDSPSASQAARRLRDARRLLRDGNFEGCVQTCRSVLDNLKALAAPGPARELKGTDPQSRDQAQRWSALFHDLYSLTSGANHDDDVIRDFTWSRSDAQAALAMTAALLARVRTG
jgi:hypothetical protein